LRTLLVNAGLAHRELACRSAEIACTRHRQEGTQESGVAQESHDLKLWIDDDIEFYNMDWPV